MRVRVSVSISVRVRVRVRVRVSVRVRVRVRASCRTNPALITAWGRGCVGVCMGTHGYAHPHVGVMYGFR